MHETLVASQQWLDTERATGKFCVTLFMWSSNDATQKNCKADLKWRKGAMLQESPFYQNALKFKNIMVQSSHVVVMVGPGNSEIWK
jgi:hypothetical protein